MENDLTQPPLRPDPEALFRYSLVSPVLNHEHRGLARPQAIEAVAAERHIDLDGKARTVSIRTRYRWLSAFEEGGPEALAPLPRQGGPRVLSRDLLDFFHDQKQADPRTSVPELMRRAGATGPMPRRCHSASSTWRSP